MTKRQKIKLKHHYLNNKNSIFEFKIYFFSFFEKLGRLLVVLASLIFIFSFLNNNFLISRLISDNILNFGSIQFVQIITILIIFFGFIISVLISLFFILPMFLIKKITTLKLWSLMLLILGIIIFLGFLLLSIFVSWSILKSKTGSYFSLFVTLNFILPALVLFFFICGIFSVILETWRYNKLFFQFYLNQKLINKIKQNETKKLR